MWARGVACVAACGLWWLRLPLVGRVVARAGALLPYCVDVSVCMALAGYVNRLVSVRACARVCV